MNRAPLIVVREPGRTPLYVALTDPLEVGRGGSGLLLDDPAVSRRHLELRPDGGRVIVSDLGSANGTTIDGSTVSGPTRFEVGDTVRLGDTTIEVVEMATAVVDVSPQPTENTSIARVAADVARSGSESPSLDWSDGTVTIVFSDIESSTELAQRMGDARWVRVLEAHNRVVRDQVARNNGVEIKAQGDGFMLAFASARRAVQCMIQVERAMATLRDEVDGERISVRFGANTGEVIVDDSGDLFGHHVNVAARIADQADGGEILVSSLVREIVETRGDLSFGQPRSVELKGLGGTWRVHPVLWRDGVAVTPDDAG